MLEASTEVRFTNPDASLFPSSHIERSVTLTKKSIRVIFSESVTSQSEVRNNTISLTGINNSTDVETIYQNFDYIYNYYKHVSMNKVSDLISICI